jgi:hypothetical protein
MARPIRTESENAVYHVTARGNERRDIYRDCSKGDSYARQLIKYIHLNPARPKDKRRPVSMKRRGELSRCRWSSHRVYAGLGNASSPNWLCTEWLGYFGRTYEMAKGDEEIRWSRRVGAETISAEVERLAAAQSDRRIAIWLHVRHGGWRMTEMVRRFGYRDGSGIHRVVERLEARASDEPTLARTLRSLVDCLSSIKS